VETAEQREAAERKELEMLKVRNKAVQMKSKILQGLSVKDRFKEGMQEGNVEKHWDQSELNTSGEKPAKISLVSNQMSKISLL